MKVSRPYLVAVVAILLAAIFVASKSYRHWLGRRERTITLLQEVGGHISYHRELFVEDEVQSANGMMPETADKATHDSVVAIAFYEGSQVTDADVRLLRYFPEESKGSGVFDGRI